MYIPERIACSNDNLKCDLCSSPATFYEFPIEGDKDFIYSACDPCWKIIDDRNQDAGNSN